MMRAVVTLALALAVAAAQTNATRPRRWLDDASLDQIVQQISGQQRPRQRTFDSPQPNPAASPQASGREVPDQKLPERAQPVFYPPPWGQHAPRGPRHSAEGTVTNIAAVPPSPPSPTPPPPSPPPTPVPSTTRAAPTRPTEQPSSSTEFVGVVGRFAPVETPKNASDKKPEVFRIVVEEVTSVSEVMSTSNGNKSSSVFTKLVKEIKPFATKPKLIATTSPTTTTTTTTTTTASPASTSTKPELQEPDRLQEDLAPAIEEELDLAANDTDESLNEVKKQRSVATGTQNNRLRQRRPQSQAVVSREQGNKLQGSTQVKNTSEKSSVRGSVTVGRLPTPQPPRQRNHPLRNDNRHQRLRQQQQQQVKQPTREPFLIEVRDPPTELPTGSQSVDDAQQVSQQQVNSQIDLQKESVQVHNENQQAQINKLRQKDQQQYNEQQRDYAEQQQLKVQNVGHASVLHQQPSHSDTTEPLSQRQRNQEDTQDQQIFNGDLKQGHSQLLLDHQNGQYLIEIVHPREEKQHPNPSPPQQESPQRQNQIRQQQQEVTSVKHHSHVSHQNQLPGQFESEKHQLQLQQQQQINYQRQQQQSEVQQQQQLHLHQRQQLQQQQRQQQQHQQLQQQQQLQQSQQQLQQHRPRPGHPHGNFGQKIQPAAAAPAAAPAAAAAPSSTPTPPAATATWDDASPPPLTQTHTWDSTGGSDAWANPGPPPAPPAPGAPAAASAFKWEDVALTEAPSAQLWGAASPTAAPRPTSFSQRPPDDSNGPLQINADIPLSSAPNRNNAQIPNIAQFQNNGQAQNHVPPQNNAQLLNNLQFTSQNSPLATSQVLSQNSALSSSFFISHNPRPITHVTSQSSIELQPVVTQSGGQNPSPGSGFVANQTPVRSSNPPTVQFEVRHPVPAASPASVPSPARPVTAPVTASPLLASATAHPAPRPLATDSRPWAGISITEPPRALTNWQDVSLTEPPRGSSWGETPPPPPPPPPPARRPPPPAKPFVPFRPFSAAPQQIPGRQRPYSTLQLAPVSTRVVGASPFAWNPFASFANSPLLLSPSSFFFR